jgi:hypothetical protein
VLSGNHAALGRQVLTWAHAVKIDESVMLGGHSPNLRMGSLVILPSKV